MDNGLIRIVVLDTGEIESVFESKTGVGLLQNANILKLAVPEAVSAGKVLSTPDQPLNPGFYSGLKASKAPRVIASGPVMARIRCEGLRSKHYADASFTFEITLLAHERQARICLKADFAKPTVIHASGAPGPHEGTYIPGVFVSFPAKPDIRPMADMAYCVTDGVLDSTNHETFINLPFRNGVFNALSLAGPNTGEYCVITRGLPDFFVMRKPKGFLGMSLGFGDWQFPYNGQYVHEYALFVPAVGKRKSASALAWREARSFVTPSVSVSCISGSPGNAAIGSLLDAGDALIAGTQLEEGFLTARVVNLGTAPAAIRLTGLAARGQAKVYPEGKVVRGMTVLPEKSVREIVIEARKQ